MSNQSIQTKENNQNEMMNIGVNTNNSEIAKSIITNTLLNSVKTGNPIIDTITSLAIVYNFRSQIVKNISIIFLLITGIIFNRITKNYDILNTLYETFSSYYNPSLFIEYIPFDHLKKIIKKYNGYEITYQINDGQYYMEIKDQYNLLAFLYKVVNEYPEIERKFMESYEYLGFCNRPSNANLYNRVKPTGEYLTYSIFEKNQETSNINIKTNLENIIKHPPKPNKWYDFDNVKFRWNIVHKVNQGENNGVSSGTKSGSNSDQFYYTMTVKSYTKTREEITMYVDNVRKELVKKLDDFENFSFLKRQKELDDISSKEFKGELYEVFENITPIDTTKSNSSTTSQETQVSTKNYKTRIINTFCRPIDTIFFKEKKQLMGVIENFKNKNGIYEKMPHRHKVGILIYGSPGAGKTSLAVAIATELKRHIIRVSLKDKDLDDDKLSYILNNYKNGYAIILDELDTHKSLRPRVKNSSESSSADSNSNDRSTESSVTLYSDSDNEDEGESSGEKCIFPSKLFKSMKKKRQMWKEPERLTLGSFLEAMDGLSTTEGRVVIAMTNHPKSLDPAILRPGRFDIVINMSALEYDQLILYFTYVFEKFEYITKQEIEDAAMYSSENKISTSSLEQACVEKYSTGSKKSLTECIVDIYNSFKF